MTKGVAKVIGSYKAWSISVDTVHLAAEGGKVKIKGGQNIITTPPPDFFFPHNLTGCHGKCSTINGAAQLRR